MKKTNFEKVREFEEIFGNTISDVPTIRDEKTKQLRINLIEEEFTELKQALENNDIVEIADALGDILYVTYGTGLHYGINLDEIVEEIHSSNLSKLDENNNPIFRESDGKILKGPNYRKPDLSSIINKYLNENT